MKLDLKFRPLKFSQILGNEGVKKLLLTRSRGRTLTEQSMMFGGPKGCGKTTLARLVARAIMCHELSQDGEPCGSCAACIAILEETYPNVEELDAASQGTVDKIRSMVKEADYESSDGRQPIYILDEAQRLSASAQDALLKAVENRSLIIILCTTEPHKIREPIRSRVEEYPIQPPSLGDMMFRMVDICKQENIEYEEDALGLISYMHQNCPRSCLMTIGSIATIGSITVDLAKQFFRFDSFESIRSILVTLGTDPVKSLELLDSLATRETPSWIKYHLMLAITSGLRETIGAKSTFPLTVKLPPFDWANLVKTLGTIEKPILADIEMALLQKVAYLRSIAPMELPPSPVIRETVSSPPPIVSTPPIQIPKTQSPQISNITPSQSSTPPKEPVSKVKFVEIDGIKFSADESLTSLDSRITSMPKTELKEEGTSVSVQLDKEHVPLTEKQFASGFLERLRKAQT